MKIHWYDSETSGLKVKEPQQMFSFAMVTTDLDLNHLVTFDEKIRIRPDVTPTKEALAVNNIDPFSLDWHANSMPEDEFCNKLNSHLEIHYQEGDIIVAYQALFDNGFLKETFDRNNKFLNLLAGPVVCFDPLKMVKVAVEKGKIVTPRLKRKDNVWYNSSKLDHVSAVLGTKGEGRAHTALVDVHTLIKTTPKAYKALTGKELKDFFTEHQYRVQF